MKKETSNAEHRTSNSECRMGKRGRRALAIDHPHLQLSPVKPIRTSMFSVRCSMFPPFPVRPSQGKSNLSNPQQLTTDHGQMTNIHRKQSTSNDLRRILPKKPVFQLIPGYSSLIPDLFYLWDSWWNPPPHVGGYQVKPRGHGI
jgi:hypothetical protein